MVTPPREPELIYTATDTRREIYLVAIDNPADLPSYFAGIEPRFAVLLVWNAEATPVATISTAVEFLYRAGCISLSTWGRGCECVHDIMDEVAVQLEIDEGPNPYLLSADDFVMTTWHTKSFRQALFYVASCARPADALSFAQTIVICVAVNEETLLQIRAELCDPFKLAEDQ